MREQCQRIALLNDMIARQTAQHVPTLRDTRGLPIHQDSELLASSFPGLLRDSGPGQNAYIMRTKCAQKRNRHIFNYSASTAYNFNTLKCTHFPQFHLNRNLTHNHNLNLQPWLSFAPLRLGAFALNQVLNPKLTKTDRFRPNLPGIHCTKSNKTEQNRTQMAGPPHKPCQHIFESDTNRIVADRRPCGITMRNGTF